MKKEVEGLLLEDLYELCYRAHTWSSFSPDKRAVQYVRDYSSMLQDDLDELGENQGNYKEKFISKFSSWMSSKSNCASSMITGPANFNVRRNEKALNTEHNKNVEFYNWRERYFKAVKRVPMPTPEDELDNALIELDEVSNLQMMYKELNSAFRKGKMNILEAVDFMEKEGYPSELIKDVRLNAKNGYGVGFPSCTLTNNNAKIKRLTSKILTMKSRIETKLDFEDFKFEGGYYTVKDDRVKIFHEEKPSKEVIQELKSNGFRWSPNWKCWCRKHTQNALVITSRLTFIKSK